MTGDDSLGWIWDKTPFDKLYAHYDTPNSRGPGAGGGGGGPEEGDWKPEERGGGLRKRAKTLGVVGAQRGLGP